MEKKFQKKNKKRGEDFQKNHFLSWHLFSVEEFSKKKQPKFFREIDADICVY